jgi:phosphate:Na+ symporter
MPIALGVLGGVGLFLLGMRLMTDGLRLAAGRGLRRILERWTATPARALGSGVLITALVQSSSAVTVAVIGFANAGLLTLGQAVFVIYGSNVGTTVTGWLVALVGFGVNVKALGLPAVGVGMALRLGSGRRAGLGEALAGFGVFLLGIDVLKTSFAVVQDQVAIESLQVTGPLVAAVFTGVGFLMTVVMQSSSASIALILTSVGGGVIPVESGAFLVIGANVGTTGTAALAVIGATSNAKRLALAHVIFNFVTGAVAMITVPLLLVLIERLRSAVGLDQSPASLIAGFHTLFNLLGVALLWPFTPALVRSLEGRFHTPEEDEGRARYLDRNALSSGASGVRALGLELARTGAIAREMAGQALRRETTSARIAARRTAVDRLLEAAGGFVTGLERQRLPDGLAAALPSALRVGRYHAETAELAGAIASRQEALDPLPAPLDAGVRAFEADVLALLERCAVEREDNTPELAAEALEAVESRYHALKQSLLEAGAGGRVPVGLLVAHLDRLSDVRRLAQQAERGARYLWRLGAVAEASDGREAGYPGDVMKEEAVASR